MRELGPDRILSYYRGLRAGGSDYVGYSEPALKRAVLRTVTPLPVETVVELGCGPNPVVPFRLAELGRRVTVLEISQDFCDTARLNATRRGVSVEVFCAPAHAAPLADGTFDLAILTEVLEHVPDELERETIEEVRRLLRPGGYFFISVPNEFGLLARYQRWRSGVQENPEHLRAYTHAHLGRLLESVGFAVERSIRVPASLEPPWRGRSTWLADRLAVRPEWSFKVAFLARKPGATAPRPPS